MFNLIVDTREPSSMINIIENECINMEININVKREKLDVGDYFIEQILDNDLSNISLLFERKTFIDLKSSIININKNGERRIDRQYRNMIKYKGLKFLIIESSKSISRDKIINGMSTNSILGLVDKWLSSGIGVIYTKSKSDTIFRILNISKKAYIRNFGKVSSNGNFGKVSSNGNFKKVSSNRNFKESFPKSRKFHFLEGAGFSRGLTQIFINMTLYDIIWLDRGKGLSYISGRSVSSGVLGKHIINLRNMSIERMLQSIKGVGSKTVAYISNKFLEDTFVKDLSKDDLEYIVSLIERKRGVVIGKKAKECLID